MRQEVASREQAEEEARVVINPLENRSNRRRAAANGTADFAVARKEGDGGFWYEVTGAKPERWVVQIQFDMTSVGYLADRLAKLGVEDGACGRLGAKPGDGGAVSARGSVAGVV